VFVLRGRTLATPPPTDGALEGITRARVLELAPGLGIAAGERSLWGASTCSAPTRCS
jgi:branched-chain amino acid aminotransferase